MARTKQTSRKTSKNGIPKKLFVTKIAKKTVPLGENDGTIKKAHRFKAGTIALKEIRKF